MTEAMWREFDRKHVSNEAAMDAYREVTPRTYSLEQVPRYMHPGIARWVMWAIPPGDFLKAVINNNLKEAVGRADNHNEQCMAEWARVMSNDVPSVCNGSRENIVAWTKRGGLYGRCGICDQPLNVPGDDMSKRFLQTGSCEQCAADIEAQKAIEDEDAERAEVQLKATETGIWPGDKEDIYAINPDKE